jgi:pantetheine-phosphate adenylyltransferase
MNRHLAPEIETILLTTDEKYGFVSSSMIKEVAGFGGDLCGLVPEKTALALENKLKEV